MTGLASGVAGRLLVALLLLPFGHCFSTTCPDQELSLGGYASFFDNELRTKFFPFWLSRVDGNNGGFDLGDGVKMIVTQSRLVWTFSHALLNGYQGNFLDSARQGFDFIVKNFLDPEAGDYYWKTDMQGNPIDKAKKLYGQAFVIFSFVEYYRASGDQTALDRALDLFRVIDTGKFDSATDFNSLMHIMEALTSLLQASGDPAVRARLERIVNVDRKAYYPDGATSNNYGHRVEFAYLKTEAEKALGLPPDLVFFETYLNGIVKDGIHQPSGGLFDFGELVWWAQAEFMSSVSVAKQYGKSGPYEAALQKLLRFVQCNFVDTATGVWVWSVDPDGSINRPTMTSEWKGSYHATRGMIRFIKAYGG